MGFFKKNEKQIKLDELEQRLEVLKRKSNNPNVTNEEMEKYQQELEQINKEMEELY